MTARFCLKEERVTDSVVLVGQARRAGFQPAGSSGILARNPPQLIHPYPRRLEAASTGRRGRLPYVTGRHGARSGSLS
jgi:hypothetical protein